MAWTVNLHNQPTFEADKINDKIAQRKLPLKLRAFTSPVAHRAPNQCLGLNGLRALLARETAQFYQAGAAVALEWREMTKTIYGATGFTGKLIAREARARQASVVLAGRNPKTLKAIAKKLDLDWRAFDLADRRGSTPR